METEFWQEIQESIDNDTFCPVCGIENENYQKGLSNERYCGCEDGHDEPDPDDLLCLTCGAPFGLCDGSHGGVKNERN